MRFAASTVVLGGPDWAENLEMIREGGCEAVELWAGFGHSLGAGPTFDYTDPREIERAGAALSRAGLTLHSMHGPIRLGGEGARVPFGAGGLEALLEAERAAIDAVMALGGRYVVTQDDAELEPEDAPHLASREALAELADYAHARGCVFCIENGAEPPAAFERLARTVRELDHPGLGVCLDVGHAQVEGYADVPRAIRECGASIRTCHIHDNQAHADTHLAAGDGVIPWRAVLEAFAEVGYRGPLVLEVWSGRGRGSPVDVLVRSRAVLESVVGDLPVAPPLETAREGGGPRVGHLGRHGEGGAG